MEIVLNSRALFNFCVFKTTSPHSSVKKTYAVKPTKISVCMYNGKSIQLFALFNLTKQHIVLC